MTSLIRRLSQGMVRRHSAPNNTGGAGLKVHTPPVPPSPNLEHLNPDELRVLGEVFNRLDQFEEGESARISQLRNEVGRLEDHMRRETVLRGSLRHVDLRLCRLCFRNKFADGVGRACAECQRRVCNQCGSFTKFSCNSRRKKNVKGPWQCLFCQKKRELACASGVWFHGGHGQPALTSAVFKRKVSDVGLTSDWGCSADVELSDSSYKQRSLGHKTDSELGGEQLTREDSLKHRGGGSRRRMTSGSTEEATGVADDEDLDVDDEQFMLERQRCRQERLQLQHKKSRRRHGRRLSVGTCTREDGILPDAPGLCPKHGSKHPQRPPDETMAGPKKHKGHIVHDSSRVRDMRSSQESLKDRNVIHPRVRQLTVATIPRKLSAPARTNMTEEQMMMMLNSGYAEGQHGGRGPKEGGDHGQRNRSHSVPVHRIFKRSSSDGDKLERDSRPRQIVEHAQVHVDSYASDNVVRVSRHKKLNNTNSSSPKATHRSRSRRYNDMSRSEGTSTSGGGLLYPHDKYVPLRKVSAPNCDRQQMLNKRPSTSSSKLHTSSTYHSSDLLFPAGAHSECRGGRRSSDRLRVNNKRQYLSLENVQNIEPHHLKVPSQRPMEIEVAAEEPSRGRAKPGSEESQDELLGRRTSDTPSVCTPDTDAGSTYSKRNCLRRSSSSYRFRIVLQRDPKDVSRRTMGLGMRVVGGKQGPDGKLGAFVTRVIRGGPADMGGIAEGDQVLEWNGRSLVDATFEEVQQTLASTGDTVQLIIMHTRMELEKRPSDCYKPPPHWRNRMSKDKPKGSVKDAKAADLSVGESPVEGGTQPSLRQDLKPPVTIETITQTHDGRLIGGRIQLKLFNDTRVNALIFTLMQAQDLSPRPGPEKEMPSAFAKLQLTSDLGTSQIYKTEAAKSSKNPEWMNTIEIPEYDQATIASTSLLVTVWDYQPLQNAVFLGEVLLDLRSEEMQNRATWYPLHDHDENTGQLPPPTPRLPKRLASDRARAGNDPEGADITVEDDLPVPSPDSPRIGKPGGKKIGILKRRVSEVAMKVGAILVDRRTSATDKERPTSPVVSPQGALSVRRHSLALLANNSVRRESTSLRKDQRRMSGQLMSGLLLGKAPSRNNSQSSNTGGNTTTDIDDENMDSKLRPAPEGNDITSMLGPGQVPPKPSQEKLVQGDIKLSFMITKGQLEVDVICSKGLGVSASGLPPDTYVKTYLVGGGKRLQKRKTKTVRGNTDPLYTQKLKYSASNVHGRYIQVLIKEKSAGFDRNDCLGEVVVKLDQLDLSLHTMGWYKLFKESAVVLGSCESLNW